MGKFKNIVSRPYIENLAGLLSTLVALKFFLRMGTFGNSLGPSLLTCGMTKVLTPLNQILRSTS